MVRLDGPEDPNRLDRSHTRSVHLHGADQGPVGCAGTLGPIRTAEDGVRP